jgi:hypothetical protein
MHVWFLAPKLHPTPAINPRFVLYAKYVCVNMYVLKAYFHPSNLLKSERYKFYEINFRDYMLNTSSNF